MKKHPILGTLFVLLPSLLTTGTNLSAAGKSPEPTFALSITDPELLKNWSNEGLSFANQFQVPNNSTRALFESSPLYRDFHKTIADDLAAEGKETSRRQSEFAKGLPIEVFQLNWLNAPASRLELTALVHRFDRRFTDDTPCGELRLVYRLSYKSARSDYWQRVPATLMLVYSAKDVMNANDCRAVARMMKVPADTSDKIAISRYKKNIASIFSPSKPAFLRLEANLQISRWPSASDLSFVQQAHYLLRVFRFESSRLAPDVLENTPDMENLKANPRLARDLQFWLEEPEQLRHLDHGTLVLPDRYLAKQTRSISPFGSARLSNQPFTALIKPNTKLTAQRLHSLDLLSCNGCHQSQAIAGFHALGREWPSESLDFTLVEPFSTHFTGIQGARTEDLKSYLQGKTRVLFPPADRVQDGGYGDSCNTTLTGYTCKNGLNCDTAHSMSSTHQVGECLTTKSSSIVGAPCDPSAIISEFRPFLDRVTDKELERCGDGYICASARAGFPGGFCSTDCNSDAKNLCVAVPVLGEFSVCLQETGLFRECAAKHHMRVQMPRCQKNSDCRQDYACVNTAHDEGYCAPPYFLPDLTLGHHPILSEASQLTIP